VLTLVLTPVLSPVLRTVLTPVLSYQVTHSLSFVHSWRPCCSAELMTHYHSASVTV